MPFVLIFILGLIVGSFVGVVIHRLPKGEQFISGRSRCPDCGHALKWYDLAPVLSFLILLGRCRYCRNKISWSYPAIEICSGIVVAVSFLFLSPSGSVYRLFWVFIMELFLILAFIDLRHFILADSVMTAIFIAIVFYEISGGKVAGTDPVVRAGSVFSLGNLSGAALLFTAIFLVWSFSNGKGIGLGDAKLAGLLGLIFGLGNSALILFAAVAIGAGTGIALIVSGKGNLKTKLPLGSFICFSAIVFIIFSHGISGRLADSFGELIFRLDLF